MRASVRENPVSTAALAVVGLLVFAAAPRDLHKTWNRLLELWTLRGESIDDARRRAYGRAYWDRIEALRAEIPEDGAYFMVASEDEGGSDCWVRFDLAPRRPWVAAIRAAGGTKTLLAARPPDGPPYVVAVRSSGEGPELLDSAAFWEAARPRAERKGYENPSDRRLGSRASEVEP